MKKRTFSILLALVLVLSLSLVTAVPVVAASEVWVDDDFTPGTPGWGTTCFATIQEGINAVEAGGTVNVAAGTYDVPTEGYLKEIQIKHKSLTLLGAQADVPIVDGQREGEESIIRGVGIRGYPNSWCVIRIKHSDVVVNGFTIENGQRGIAIQGIGPDGISTICVSYNYIEEIGYASYHAGIFRDNAAADVTIDHNYIASNPRGIATNGGGTTITDNTFYGNGKAIDFNGGDPYGKYFPDCTESKYPTIISGNAFKNDSTSITLKLDKCHQSITITGNDITEARSAAIKTWNVYDVDIVNPAIHYNNIWNNEFGINNQVEEINLDATSNWWGHASGPSGEDGRVNKAGKVIGKGDAVSNNVEWDPWLPQPVGHTKHDPVPPGLEKRR